MVVNGVVSAVAGDLFQGGPGYSEGSLNGTCPDRNRVGARRDSFCVMRSGRSTLPGDLGGGPLPAQPK